MSATTSKMIMKISTSHVLHTLGWAGAIPFVYFVWYINNLLIYAGLTFYTFQLSSSHGLLKWFLIFLIPPIIITIFQLIIKISAFTSYIGAKSKILYITALIIFTVNQISSSYDYCINIPVLPTNSVLIQIPCSVNAGVAFVQIAIIIAISYWYIKCEMNEITS